MSKEREDDIEEQEATETSPADDKPEISVSEKDGEAHVEVSRESVREKRERRRADEMRKVIEESTKPLRDQIQMLSQIRQQPTQQAVQQQQAPAVQAGADPEWKKLVKDQTRIVALVRASTDPAEIQRLEDEWHDAEYKKGEIIASKSTAAMRAQLARDNPPPEDPVFRLVRSEFPDVLNYGPDATMLASSHFQRAKIMAARERRPFDDMAEHRKSLTAAAEELGIRQKALPARNPAQQARFASPSTNSTGSGAGGGATRALTASEKTMARAFAGKGVPDAEAFTKWSQMMGPEYFSQS
jgi:hypothetical protein